MESNYINLSNNQKKSIAEAIHKTIAIDYKSNFSTNYNLCFYYANLGMDLCTAILRRLNKNRNLFYTTVGGSFSMRISKDSSDNLRGLNWGAGVPNLESGNFHLWIVGVIENYEFIQPCEFIDFTSRFYGKNSSELGCRWEREDIPDYLWMNDKQLEDYGISVKPDDELTTKIHAAWKVFDLNTQMLKQAFDNYKNIINQIPLEDQ